MDGIAQAFAAIVQLGMGLAGQDYDAKKREQAKAIYEQLRREFAGIEVPEFEQVEAVMLSPSAMEGVRTDPALAEAQRGALGSLDDIISGGGLAQVDSATLNRLASQVARRNRSAQAGIGAEMAARGMQGSGVDIGARLAAAQAAQERNSQAGQDIAAQALMRRFNAISQKGEMAGRMRGQEFDEQSALANARDTINRLNAASRQQAAYYNANRGQQKFLNQMAKQAAMANPSGAMAGLALNAGQQGRQTYGNLGAAAGSGISGAAKSLKSWWDKDTSDEEDDDAWLNRNDDD